MTQFDSMPSDEDLESLFVNNDKLSRIETHLNRFNPIRTMRMEHMEIRHSAILAWLLDPRETHGFSDRFLRALLCEAMRGQSGLGSPTALEISQADLRDAEVRREWLSIDIFILLPRLNWAFIIENKFRSSQGEGQLAKYAERIRSAFEPRVGKLQVRGLLLTLDDEQPADENFVPINYRSICDILPSLMTSHAEVVRPDVAMFVGQYIEIIREATGMSNERQEMEQLARQLYRSHSKVLDFIVAHGAATDFVLAMETIVGPNPEQGTPFAVGEQKFVFHWSNNASFNFIPEAWAEAMERKDTPWAGCKNWGAGLPISCWLQLSSDGSGNSGRLRLIAEVGPLSDHHSRKALIEAISATELANVGFQSGAANLGKRFSRFLRKNDRVIQDVHNMDDIARGIRQLLASFDHVFTGLAPVLADFGAGVSPKDP